MDSNLLAQISCLFLQLYPGFRNDMPWLFYQTDTMIKEMIRGYNFTTVRAGELVADLRKEDFNPHIENTSR